MGKRTSGLTGLSRYALESFKNESSKPPSPAPSAHEPGAYTPVLNHTQRETEGRPNKRRKTNKSAAVASKAGTEEWNNHTWVEKYDATGLVPHYTNVSQVPDHLKKYFYQRTRFLSLYSSPPGCLLDPEGWYSITPELIADQIAERCRCDTVLDAFCGVGGNAIAFAKTCQRVIALDTSPTRLALARHNAQIYGVADRIEFILTDYISFAYSYLSLPSSTSSSSRKIDVVFLSPPWGGPSYLESPSKPRSGPPIDESIIDDHTDVHPEYTLASIQPIHGADLFRLSRRITPNIAYYLPRNTSLEEVGALLETTQPESETALGSETEKVKEKEWDHGESEATSEAAGKGKGDSEMVEVEEAWMGTKLKALTCYFGGLAEGQGELF